MSLIAKCIDDIRRYEILKNNVTSIIMELSVIIDDTSDVSAQIKSRYQIDDGYTPVALRSSQLKTDLEIVYNTLNKEVVPAIDSAIADLHETISRLEEEEKNDSEQETI